MFDLFQHCAHVTNGAIAQEGHGAMRDAAMGFNFGPPDAPMPQTDAVFVQGFGDCLLYTSRCV